MIFATIKFKSHWSQLEGYSDRKELFDQFPVQPSTRPAAAADESALRDHRSLSPIAVDDADDDDDRHARDSADGENQPPIAETSRDDVAQKDRARVLRVTAAGGSTERADRAVTCGGGGCGGRSGRRR